MSRFLRRALQVCALAAVVAFLAAPPPARAQSSMPFGLWQGERSGDYIWIGRDFSCATRGLVNVAGTCEWLANRSGGVLNLYYPMPLQAGRIGWSVLRLD